MTKFKTAVLVVAGVLGLAMAVSPAASQSTVDTNGTDNSTVTVSVAEKTAVDISPSDLAYTGVDPGSNQAVTDGGFSSVEVENIGSTNISHVWFNASMPTSNPFGTGVSTNYDAGNFIQIKPKGDLSSVTNTQYTFVNRKEFSTANIPEYIFRQNSNFSIGRFRVADQEYFWAMEEATPTTCATSTNSFRVGNSAHNLTATGSNDFNDGTGEFIGYQPTDGGTAGDAVVDNVNISGANYRVNIDCSANTAPGNVTVTRSRYNVELAESDIADVTNGAGEYVVNETATNTAAIQPGEHFAVDTRVSIPQGVAQGQISDGFLRVLVNTQ